MPESCGRHREEARSSWARPPRCVARSQGCSAQRVQPRANPPLHALAVQSPRVWKEDCRDSARSEATRSPSGCSARVKESGRDPNRSTRKSASAHRRPRAPTTTGTSTADTHTRRDIDASSSHRHHSNRCGSVNVPGARVGTLHAHVTPPTASHGKHETCKRGAEALSDTFRVLWPPRTDALPVRGAAGCRMHVQEYASRRPRPRWTAERLSVFSNWEMDL